MWLLGGSNSNPFEKWVRESSLTGSPHEAVVFLCKEVKDLTTRHLLLAMEVDELKEQLKGVGRLPKRLCKSIF